MVAHTQALRGVSDIAGMLLFAFLIVMVCAAIFKKPQAATFAGLSAQLWLAIYLIAEVLR